jgi:hypothetical protein
MSAAFIAMGASVDAGWAEALLSQHLHAIKHTLWLSGTEKEPFNTIQISKLRIKGVIVIYVTSGIKALL